MKNDSTIMRLASLITCRVALCALLVGCTSSSPRADDDSGPPDALVDLADVSSDLISDTMTDSAAEDLESTDTGIHDTNDADASDCAPRLPGQRTARVGDTCCRLITEPFDYADCDDGLQVTILERDRCEVLAETADTDLSDYKRRVAFAAQGCTEVGGNLWLEGEHSEIYGLESLQRIGGTLVIDNQVTSLAPLSGLEQVGALYIEHTQLETLDGLALRRIEWSAPSVQPPTTRHEIQFLRTPLLRDIRALRSLEADTQLNVLRVRYTDALHSLEGLEPVTNGGYVEILHNAALKTLSGLDNVQAVYGLVVNQSPSLRDVSLPRLETAEGGIGIGNSPLLETIHLPVVRDVGDTVSIVGNPSLIRIDGFDQLQRVQWTFNIEHNDALTEIANIAGAIDTLRISNNLALERVALPNVRGDVIGISDCPSLTTIEALGPPGTQIGRLNLLRLPALTQLAQVNASVRSLSVIDTPLIESLAGVHGPLEGGSLTIRRAPALNQLPDIDTAQFGGMFSSMWLDSTNLASLTGLEGLDHINQILLTNNPRLADITSLGSLSRVDTTFTVVDNPMLPQCQAEALLAGLETPPTTIDIAGNDETAACP